MDSESVVQHFQSLEAVVRESVDALKDELKKLRVELDKERSARRLAENEAVTLRTRIAELTKKDKESIWASFREAENKQPVPPPPPPPPPPKQYVVGTSLLRNIDEEALTNTEVHALSGATTKDVITDIAKLTNCCHLYIVTGTNDIDNLSEDDVISDLHSLIDTAKTITSNITIATLMHRVDTDSHVKTDNINQELRVLCTESDITVAECDNFALLRDGSVNPAIFIHDGYHLNKSGVDLMCKTLKVPLRESLSSSYTQRLYPNKPNTRKARAGSGMVKMSAPSRGHSEAALTAYPVLADIPEDKVRRFKGPRDPLSNFYPVQIKSQGKYFHSACQLIQYRHARIAHDHDAVRRIMTAPDGPSCYWEAKKIPRNESWLLLRDEVISEVAQMKYMNCEIFRQELQNCRDMLIVEDTPCPYWGRGPDMKGQNRMGRILMSLRDNPPAIAPNQMHHKLPAHSTPERRHNPSASFLQWSSLSPGSQRCTFCGERNHSQDSCRHGRPIPCDRCDVPGHKAKFCTRDLNMSWA